LIHKHANRATESANPRLQPILSPSGSLIILHFLTNTTVETKVHGAVCELFMDDQNDGLLQCDHHNVPTRLAPSKFIIISSIINNLQAVAIDAGCCM
jgi:hypothetical protein